MTKENLEKEVHKEIARMMEQEPMSIISYVLIEMGKSTLEINAEEMAISVQHTLNGRRYKTTAAITVKSLDQ